MITDLKMKNIVCGSYHKMSVTAITALFATSVWTAATIRFITQTPRMMKNKGNALTIGFVRAFLLCALKHEATTSYAGGIRYL